MDCRLWALASPCQILTSDRRQSVPNLPDIIVNLQISYVDYVNEQSFRHAMLDLINAIRDDLVCWSETVIQNHKVSKN